MNVRERRQLRSGYNRNLGFEYNLASGRQPVDRQAALPEVVHIGRPAAVGTSMPGTCNTTAAAG